MLRQKSSDPYFSIMSSPRVALFKEGIVYGTVYTRPPLADHVLPVTKLPDSSARAT
jgi:hypothetical protein